MDNNDLQPLFVLRGHKAIVESLTFHEKSHILFSGDDNAILKVWNLETRRPMLSKHIFTRQFQIINLLYSNNNIICQSRNGIIKIFNIREDVIITDDDIKIPLFQIESGHCGLCKFSLLNDNILIVPGEELGDIEIYDLKSNKKVSQFKLEKNKTIMTLKGFKKNGNLYICCGDSDGYISIRDIRDNSKIVSEKKLFKEPISCLDIDINNEGIIAGSLGTEIALVIIKDMDLIYKKKMKTENEGISDVVIRKDRRIFASCSGTENKIKIWDYKKSKFLCTLKLHNDRINRLIFQNDIHNAYLASASADSTISIWNIYNLN